MGAVMFRGAQTRHEAGSLKRERGAHLGNQVQKIRFHGLARGLLTELVIILARGLTGYCILPDQLTGNHIYT